MAETTALPAAVQPRRRELIFGTAFVTVAVGAVFLALIGVYVANRQAAIQAGAAWYAKNPIPLTQPNMQMLTLFMSAVTVQWAVWAIARNDRAYSFLALGLTIFLGLAYLNQTSFLIESVGLKMSENAEAPYFYGVVGFHVLMAIVAVLFVALMAFRALGGQYSSRRPDGIAAAALFWHAMVAAYAVIWWAVYIMK